MSDRAEIVATVVDHVAKAIEALGLEVEGRDGATSPLRVLRGWPGADEDLELPTASLEPGRPAWDMLYPQPIEERDGDDPDTVEIVYEVAHVRVPIQLDLWTATKTHRFEIEPQLLELFLPALEEDDDGVVRPQTAGLEFELEELHGERGRVFLEDTGQEDKNAKAGTFRANWELRANTALWKVTTTDRAEFTANTTVEE